MLQFLQATELIKKQLNKNDAEAEKARKEKQKLQQEIREQNINNFLELYTLTELLEEATKRINDNNEKARAAHEANEYYNRYTDGFIIDLSLIPDNIARIKNILANIENDLLLNHNIDTEQLKKLIKEEYKKKLEL